MAVLLVFAAVFGLAIGSFLNVVAYRVPAGLSVVSPPSACPGCGTAIASRDNVPILSWLLLRGRCRHCGMRISARYPIVEGITGAAFLIASVRFAPHFVADLGVTPTASAADALEWIAFLYLAAISVALAAIDLDVRRLPDRIVLPAYAIGAALLFGADVLRLDWVALATAAAGAGASALLYAVLWFARPGGMGLGDVKLAGVLGLFLGQLGIGPLVVGLFAAFVLGGVFGIALILRRGANRTSAIPFGPWMLAGAWIGVLVGSPIATAYLTLSGFTPSGV